jgi:TRAP-type C4-dicarboxylate transport system permease small subunit
MSLLKKINDNFEEYFCVLLFSLMTTFTFAQVLARFVFNFSLAWTEELGRYTFVWLVYMAACAAVKHTRHIRVEILLVLFKGKWRSLLYILADTIWLLFSIYLARDGLTVATMIMGHGQTSPAVGIPVGWIYTIIPLGFSLMALRVLQRIVLDIKGLLSPAPSTNLKV